jgi:membrane protein YqaA with SNARE-associated domain
MIATAASTLSGFAGYLLGHFLWDLIGSWVIPHLVSAASFAHLSAHFQMYEQWAVFFGALVPFPLKALSLVAGVFHLGAIPFVTYLAAARLVRFALIGGAMALWGVQVKQFVDKHFHRLFMLVGAKIAIAFFFFWVWV